MEQPRHRLEPTGKEVALAWGRLLAQAVVLVGFTGMVALTLYLWFT